MEVRRWTDDETDRLAEYIADGWTFGGASRALKRSRNACIGRWNSFIVRQFGWQGK